MWLLYSVIKIFHLSDWKLTTQGDRPKWMTSGQDTRGLLPCLMSNGEVVGPNSVIVSILLFERTLLRRSNILPTMFSGWRFMEKECKDGAWNSIIVWLCIVNNIILSKIDCLKFELSILYHYISKRSSEYK